MASEPTLSQNLDIIHGTLEKFMVKDPVINYGYNTYEDFNTIMAKNVMQVTGKKLKGYLTVGTVGNAGFNNPWAEDNLVVKNITKSFEIDPYKHCKGGMAFNDVEASVNMGPEEIFDAVKVQYKKAKIEVIDKIRLAIWTGLTSANDSDNMYSVFDWLSLGTVTSTGGYTGYKGRYNDGSTPGTAFNKGGLTSSASVNSEFASYYADHQGNLDESLIRIINEAMMVQNFKPPVMVEGNNIPKVNYACYTSKNVILTLNQLYAKLNSNVGPNMFGNGYYPLSQTKVPGSIPLVWVDILDTDRDSIYGSDPIVGINHSTLYPVYLKNWNFKITKDKASNRHLVSQYFIDWCGQIWCDAPRYAGFLISDHPSA